MIIQQDGYKIFNVTRNEYLGEPYSFIANSKNAHDKLLFFKRHRGHRGEIFEVHKFTINEINVVKIE